MVAHLLRLKLTLLRNSIKRSPWQLVGLILAGVYGLGMLATVLVALAAGAWGSRKPSAPPLCWPARRCWWAGW